MNEQVRLVLSESSSKLKANNLSDEQEQKIKVLTCQLQSMKNDLFDSTESAKAMAAEYDADILELDIKLDNALRQIKEMSALPDLVKSISLKLSSAEEEKESLANQIPPLMNEIELHKCLVEKLKNNIKALSDSKGRDFAETFEEVMREEMMSMKTAFEAKLRAAKTEIEIVSRRHQQQIQNLQTISSPLQATKLGRSA